MISNLPDYIQILDMENLEVQKEEIAVLESIYLDDLEMVTTMSPFKVSVRVKPYFDA